MTRLYQAAETLRGLKGQSEVARALNASPQTINNWEARGISKPGLLKAQAIIGCSATWLESGEGEMAIGGSHMGSSTLPFLSGARRVSVGAKNDDIPIKKVALTLQAGIMGFEATQVHDGDTTIDIPRRFIEENDLVPQCLLAISIKGDSMWPLMIDGDSVVINIADTKPINNELYAINFDGEAVIKRMVYENRQWYLDSMNPDPQYKRRVCRGGECIVVGRVVFQPGRKLIGRV
ncbi:MAG: S24 family peptidase [Pseudomonadota bacterium]